MILFISSKANALDEVKEIVSNEDWKKEVISNFEFFITD